MATQNTNNIDTATIGGRIKALRTKRGISQQVLADFLCVDKTVVCRWENGERKPDENMVAKIAEVFQVSKFYIAYGSDPRENEDYIDLKGLTFRQIKIVRDIVEEFRSGC